MTEPLVKILPLNIPNLFYTTGFKNPYPEYFITALPAGVPNLTIKERQTENLRQIERFNSGALKQKELEFMENIKFLLKERRKRMMQQAQLLRQRLNEQVGQGNNVNIPNQQAPAPGGNQPYNSSHQPSTGIAPGDSTAEGEEAAAVADAAGDGEAEVITGMGGELGGEGMINPKQLSDKTFGLLHKTTGHGIKFGVAPLKKYNTVPNKENYNEDTEDKIRQLRRVHALIDKNLQGEELPNEIYEQKYPKRIRPLDI